MGEIGVNVTMRREGRIPGRTYCWFSSRAWSPPTLKKPLIAALLTAAAVAALAVPAGAAVPRTPAAQTIPCNDGSGKSAQVWMNRGQFAEKNPCRTEWLFVLYGGQYYNGAYGDAAGLAPGSHFNWTNAQARKYLGLSGAPIGAPVVLGRSECDAPDEGGPSHLIYSYKDVRPADC